MLALVTPFNAGLAGFLVNWVGVLTCNGFFTWSEAIAKQHPTFWSTPSQVLILVWGLSYREWPLPPAPNLLWGKEPEVSTDDNCLRQSQRALTHKPPGRQVGRSGWHSPWRSRSTSTSGSRHTSDLAAPRTRRGCSRHFASGTCRSSQSTFCSADTACWTFCSCVHS